MSLKLKEINVKKFMKLLQNTMTFKKNMLCIYIDNNKIKSFSKNDTGTMFKYIESGIDEYCTSYESDLSERGTIIFTSAEKIINVMKNLGTEECDITIDFTDSNNFGKLSTLMCISNKFFEVNLPAMSEDLCNMMKSDIYFNDALVSAFVDVSTIIDFNIPDIKQIISCMNISDENDNITIYTDENKEIYLSQLVDKEMPTNFNDVPNLSKVFKYNIEKENVNVDKPIAIFYKKENLMQINTNNEYKVAVVNYNNESSQLKPLRFISEGVCKELYVICNLLS